MEFGLAIPHTGKFASPEYVRDFCQTADELGYDGLWTVDHPAIPPSSPSAYTLGEEPKVMPDGAVARNLVPNYEMTSTMLFVAGITQRVKLGSSVCVVPLRNPVMNARILATLDIYSGGRLIYGVGVGWLKEEADAMQMPWDRRGARTEEHIALLRKLWMAEGDTVSFDGEFYRFPDIHPDPRPFQKPSPPIVIGGHSDIALRRAARIGDGWTAGPMLPERLQALIEKLRGYLDAEGRDPDAFPIYANAGTAITAESGAKAWKFTAPNGAIGIGDVDALVERFRLFERMGVNHLRVGPSAPDRKGHLEIVEQLATHVLPACR
ncbi:TIGR03619 family F420-dependent LLM class oxidoreductase [Myxococcota bacterium]|nr:TIGR03619 family F420-dependent LLM class oxidoreductase [Myxococcota bacterium]